MIACGINALNHGSSIAIVEGRELLYFDSFTEDTIPHHALEKAKGYNPERLYWYERPWLKKARQVYAGQYRRAFSIEEVPSFYINNTCLQDIPLTYTSHHGSHAAAGFYTSSFEDSAIIVMDAIGEWESTTIWEHRNGRMRKLWRSIYPNSLGLFYSAFTKLLGFQPISEEGKLEALAAKGDPLRYRDDISKYFNGVCSLTINLHKGVCQDFSSHEPHDLAAAVQAVFEQQVIEVSQIAKSLTNTDNLVYTGGCAFNKGAQQIMRRSWNSIHTPHNPGDALSAIGCILFHRYL